MFDAIVIGAGPVGLACAIEAQHAGLASLVIEKEGAGNSILGYPLRMEFFSTPDLSEFGGYPSRRNRGRRPRAAARADRVGLPR